jgi:transposase
MQGEQGNTKTPAQTTELLVVEPNTAGIDVASRLHFVAVPPDRDSQPIRQFGCYTADLIAMAEWLIRCGIKTVAMESTGVYWVPVYDVLQQYGLDVHLVDARQVKNVSGKKSDVQDCEWLRRLHSYGLLSSAFRPKPEIVILRGYWRHRRTLVEQCARLIQLMHKALEQMNVQLHKAVKDVTGQTGMAIIRAIVAGEREPSELVRFRHPGCKLGVEEFVAALSGNYKPEHVFALEQNLVAFDSFQDQLGQCDLKIQAYMAQLPSRAESLKPQKVAKRRKNQPHFDLRTEQIRISGVDLCTIPGIEALTAQTAFTEVGLDVDRFPSEKHFTSWLCLSPNNRKTGGRIRSRRTRRSAHRLATALRVAAQSVGRSHTSLGAFHRHLCTRLGPAKATTATARKLACLIYRMLKYGQPFVEQGQHAYELAHRQRAIRSLGRRARHLGLNLLNPTTGELL